MAKIKLSTRLPVVVEEPDYHGFEVLQRHLNTIFAQKIAVEEIGITEYGSYVAVVYSGRRPAQSVFDKFKRKFCFDVEE